MNRDLLDPELQPDPEEIGDEINLRPQNLDDYIGQRKHIALLEVMMAAARPHHRPRACFKPCASRA